MRLLMKGFFFSLMLFLSACSFTSPIQDQQQQYVLEQFPKMGYVKKQSVKLVVSRPRANPVYDTTQIAYAPRQWEINYFSKSRWGTRPSEMIQGLLVQTLQSVQAFQAVSSGSVTGKGDLRLNSEIIRFREDLSGRAPVFQFVYRVELLQGPEGRLLASRQFSATVPLTIQSPYAVVAAANQAVSQVLRQVALFCTTKHFE